MGSSLACTALSHTEGRTEASGFLPLLARQMADVSTPLSKEIAEDAKEACQIDVSRQYAVSPSCFFRVPPRGHNFSIVKVCS
jgi:hypothetical protein